MSDVAKYGRRNVPKMIKQIDDLRKAISAEATPAIQAAWDAVEEHIDYAYRRADLPPVVNKELLTCVLRDLIRDQSEGEWGDDLIENDVKIFTARILAALVTPAPQPHNDPASYPDTPEAQRPSGGPLARPVKGTP